MGENTLIIYLTHSFSGYFWNLGSIKYLCGKKNSLPNRYSLDWHGEQQALANKRVQKLCWHWKNVVYFKQIMSEISITASASVVLNKQQWATQFSVC